MSEHGECDVCREVVGVHAFSEGEYWTVYCLGCLPAERRREIEERKVTTEGTEITEEVVRV